MPSVLSEGQAELAQCCEIPHTWLQWISGRMALGSQGQLWDCMVVLGRLPARGGLWEPKGCSRPGLHSWGWEEGLRLEGFAQRS